MAHKISLFDCKPLQVVHNFPPVWYTILDFEKATHRQTKDLEDTGLVPKVSPVSGTRYRRIRYWSRTELLEGMHEYKSNRDARGRRNTFYSCYWDRGVGHDGAA